ncbi:MAG: alpha/beta hydrolase [Phenylobacterium sp.]
MTDQNHAMRDDIAFMRALAEAGRDGPMAGGSILVAAGVIYAACGVAAAAGIAYNITWGGFYPLVVWFGGTGVFLAALSLIKRRLGPAADPARGASVVWTGTGWAIGAIVFSLIILSVRTQVWMLMAALPSVILAIYGAAWFVGAMLSKLRWLYAVAFGSFAMALVSAWFAADANRLFADSQLVVRDRFSDEVIGQGPDLVLIPGLASSRATWKATAERLRGRYRLHLIQVAGFAGETARGNGEGEVVIATAEAIDAYLVEKQLTPAVLIGHSLGGTMIPYLAEKHPEHLRTALVVDALPFFGVLMAGPQATAETIRPMAAQMRDGTIAADDAAYAKMMAPQLARMVQAPADRETVQHWSLVSDRGVAARALYDDLTLDLRPALSTIHTPITLIYPDNAPAGAPVAMVDGLYKAMFAPAPAIKLKRIDNSLHFIMLDQPQAFADALDAFLAEAQAH